jgi:hypothetical protein
MKFNSSWLLLILFLALAGVAWYMLGNKPDKMGALMADRDFAVKDISQVQKIFLATRDKQPITLEKINGVWMLNGKYKAAANPVKNLLETMKEIRIQSIPSKGHQKGIMEGIAVYGIKVEIYGSNHDLLKTYYVGGATQQEYGTYFYMEHGSQPYIMEIPHFVGNVRERYDLDFTDWRDQSIFEFSAASVEKLTVEYPSQMENSFILKKNGDQFELYDFVNSNNKIQVSAPAILKSYLQSYEGIGAEDIQNENPMRKEAQRISSYCTISAFLNGKETPLTYKFFPVKADSSGKVHYEFNQALIDKGDLFRWHIDRSDGDFMLVQYPNIQPILKRKDDFK